MEDFDAPPQDDAPIETQDPSVIPPHALKCLLELRFRQLLRCARAVIPAVIAAWTKDEDDGALPENSKELVVAVSFDYAELMLAEADRRTKEYFKSLRGDS